MVSACRACGIGSVVQHRCRSRTMTPPMPAALFLPGECSGSCQIVLVFILHPLQSSSISGPLPPGLFPPLAVSLLGTGLLARRVGTAAALLQEGAGEACPLVVFCAHELHVPAHTVSLLSYNSLPCQASPA